MTTKILGTQIENFSITTEKLAANVTANYATTAEVADYATSSQFAQFAFSLAPKITSVQVSNSSFVLVDDTAVNVGGGYVVVTGNNFQSGATVFIDTTPALAVTRVNETTLNVQLPPKLSATYNLFVVNPDSSTGIRVNGLTYSAFPGWVTASPLADQTSAIAFSTNFSAPSAISYELTNGSTLPPGTELLANGYFYGNVTTLNDTTYSFDIKATDAELQDTTKSFLVSVINPPVVTSIQVANSAFTVLDDTAVNTGGGFIVITGNHFKVGASVNVLATPATAVTRVDSTRLNVQVPAGFAGTYNVSVTNSDGRVGNLINGLTYSLAPVWVTASPLGNIINNRSFAINFSASPATSYAVTSGSLPIGSTLLANGYFFGNVTIDSDTNYSFNVAATDAELQDTTKSFSVSAINVPFISSVAIADATYTVLDDTAVNTGGGFIVVTGNHFNVGATVNVVTTPATTVTRVDNTRLNVQVPARVAGTYNVSVTNTNGGTGNLINGLTYSAAPVWTTATTLPFSIVNNRAFTFNFSASPATSYVVTSGSLPSGSTLLANGYFFGTVSVGSDTNYTFSIKATDAELQDVTRSFSVPGIVTVNELYGWSGTPTLIGTDINWSRISTGSGLKTSGALFGYLTNTNGELGTNSTVSQNPPVQIGALTDWSFVASGGGHTAAVKTGGTLWTWGINTFGQLGNLNRVSRSSPAQVGAATDWARVATAGSITHAIKTTGTMWGWGSNSSGQVGANLLLTAHRSSPTQIGADTNWSRVSNNVNVGMAIRTTGTLWGWGSNVFGQLGLNNRTDSAVPLQVGALTNWAEIFVDSQGFVARKTDGTMWACGVNTAGQLGINNIISRSSPVQIGTDTNWSQVGMVSNRVKAIRTNGQLWYVASATSSPTQIGSASGLTWKQLNTGGTQSSIAG